MGGGRAGFLRPPPLSLLSATNVFCCNQFLGFDPLFRERPFGVRSVFPVSLPMLRVAWNLSSVVPLGFFFLWEEMQTQIPRKPAAVRKLCNIPSPHRHKKMQAGGLPPSHIRWIGEEAHSPACVEVCVRHAVENYLFLWRLALRCLMSALCLALALP